jgi:pimeloyl-ACP methyl ester carboxylesterase
MTDNQAARDNAVTSYRHALTRTVSVGGVSFAYRELGRTTGVPVVFLTHLAAVLDNWDPRVVDGIAAQHRVITFDNRGVGASTGKTPDTIQAMASDAVTFIRALGLERVDLLGFSMGGMIAQVIAHDQPQLVRKLILAGTGPAGGEGITNVTKIAHLDFVRGAFTLQDPKQFLFFTRTANGRRAGKQFLSRLKERTENRDRRSRSGPTSRNSRRSTAGAWTRRPTCPSSVSPCWSPTVKATGWCRRTTRSTWPGGCPTVTWSSTPTPATAGSSSTTSSSSAKR